MLIETTAITPKVRHGHWYLQNVALIGGLFLSKSLEAVEEPLFGLGFLLAISLRTVLLLPGAISHGQRRLSGEGLQGQIAARLVWCHI